MKNKTKNTIPAKIEVGSIIRIPAISPHNHPIWEVTGIHYAASQSENLVSLKRLDLNPGIAYGKTQTESIVPMAILGTHPLLQNP